MIPKNSPYPDKDRTVCGKCGVKLVVGVNQYENDASHPRFICKKCKALQIKAWRIAHPEAVRKMNRGINLRSKYGITPAQYDQLFKEQKGVCKLCKQPALANSIKTMNLCVDHDHVTDRVRGLLCHSCNRMLGQIETFGITQEQIAVYLKSKEDY